MSDNGTLPVGFRPPPISRAPIVFNDVNNKSVNICKTGNVNYNNTGGSQRHRTYQTRHGCIRLLESHAVVFGMVTKRCECTGHASRQYGTITVMMKTCSNAPVCRNYRSGSGSWGKGDIGTLPDAGPASYRNTFKPIVFNDAETRA